MKPLLSAKWTNLAVFNFDSDENLLKPFLPSGTDFNYWNNQLLMSIVGFTFSEPRIFGIPSPSFRTFPEVNLRFYVKRKVNKSWRKGVVFIKEIAPHFLIGLTAKMLYRENFATASMKFFTSKKDFMTTQYEFCINNKWNELRIDSRCDACDCGEESIEHFISDHYFGYTRLNAGQTREFYIEHVPWKIFPCIHSHIQLHTAEIYGKEFATYLDTPPVSCFVMDGSFTKVSAPVAM